MTHKEIIHLIENPECLNEDTLPAISRLVEEYPYFQTARLLYTINLLAVKDAFFPSELKKSAFHLNDRENLFYKLNGDKFRYMRKSLEEPVTLRDTFSLIDSFLTGTKETDNLLTDYPVSIREKSSLKTTLPLSSYEIKSDSSDTPAATLKYQDIIDQFLENDEKEPVRITLNDNAPFTPPVQKVQEEESDNTPFFSETLAKIYIKQHKYEKAIEIIKKLSLLYPEKSVYFADQIRYLNKLIINAKK